jgi:hypothetical protein
MKRKPKNKNFVVDVRRTIKSDVEVKVKAPTKTKARQKARAAMGKDKFEPLDDDEITDKVTSVSRIR